MTSYATKKLESELQKAVASRNATTSTVLPSKLPGEYRVSPEIAAYLKRMSDYRERAKTVRIGSY
ncbi:MAG: hypothetical protein Q8M02_02820 [Candidatus Didemnitutus sp.]|nr:hypothetical protein [Candidatus Didemnitutus sp.]